MTTDRERAVADLLVGASPVMQTLRETILRFAPSRIPILILGPTGAGKELVAKALHRASGRRGGFVPFNVCAIADTMFEDALFGHVRGAFTGATADSRGYLREADGGTLLLDEISGLSLNGQAKLLRAIETGEFRPVGAGRDAASDFRVVAASNEDLDTLADAGRFRVDLLHRLGGFILRVPSLAARRDDLPVLVKHLAAEFGERCPRVAADAMEHLVTHSWPGNVRELRRVVERLLTMADGAPITRPIVEAAVGRTRPDPNAVEEPFARRRLVAMLIEAGWDTERVAERLGVHRATVYRRMRRLGVELRREAYAACATPPGESTSLADARD